MLGFLPAPVRGVIMALLLIVNTLFWAVPVYVMIFVKLLTPRGPVRDGVSRITAALAQHWAMVNVWLVDTLLPMRWDLRIDAETSPF